MIKKKKKKTTFFLAQFTFYLIRSKNKNEGTHPLSYGRIKRKTLTRHNANNVAKSSRSATSRINYPARVQPAYFEPWHFTY